MRQCVPSSTGFSMALGLRGETGVGSREGMEISLSLVRIAEMRQRWLDVCSREGGREPLAIEDNKRRGKKGGTHFGGVLLPPLEIPGMPASLRLWCGRSAVAATSLRRLSVASHAAHCWSRIH